MSARFTDTVTLFKKQSNGMFTKHVVRGVQWSDKTDVSNTNGMAVVSHYSNVTFFEGAYEDLDLPSFTEEDAIFYGEIKDEVEAGRISALLRKYPKSGVIKSVNDNSNRAHLKNIKVVLV